MNTWFASIPSDEVEVIFLLKSTGPSNCESSSPVLPPSTLIVLETVISAGLMISIPVSVPTENTSSPVTVGIGVSNTSSLPVLEEIFLLPTKKSPLSFIPVNTVIPPALLKDCDANCCLVFGCLICFSGRAVE